MGRSVKGAEGDAILKKVKAIIDNTQYVSAMRIHISCAEGEVTTINYCIEEYVLPDSVIKGEEQGEEHGQKRNDLDL